jgi:hypothetical protein
MTLRSIELPGGCYRNGTEQQAEGRFYETDLVRFDPLRPVGGWVQRCDTAVRGKTRAMLIWKDNSGVAWTALGSSKGLFIMDRAGVLYDITPIRATASLTDPFTTTNGSSTVTVADTAHGALTGDFVVFSGATAVGGLTIDGTYEVTRVDADSYTIDAGSDATSSASGGGSVTADYLIPTGADDATFQGGYGSGLYGAGLYGTPRADTANPSDCSVWSLDTFGQYLRAVRNDHGTIYGWSLVTADRAVAVSGAPTARAIHTTAENVLMALGYNGNPRAVKTSDIEDDTDWTASTTNYSRTFELKTAGKLMCGRQVTGGSLVLTDVDAWFARFVRQPFAYGFERRGDNGIIAMGAIAVVDGKAYWMGTGGFFIFQGWVEQVPCDIWDWIQTNINRSQASKITAIHNSDFAEIEWHFISDGSTEIDRAAILNYRTMQWRTEFSKPRTCGSEKGPFTHPLMVSADGIIFQHEIGYTWGGATPYAETGPFKIMDGDRTFEVAAIIPDERNLGDCQVSFGLRDRPTGDETVVGPYSLTEKTDVRFSVRHMTVKYEFVRQVDSRVGAFALDGKDGARR